MAFLARAGLRPLIASAISRWYGSPSRETLGSLRLRSMSSNVSEAIDENIVSITGLCDIRAIKA